MQELDEISRDSNWILPRYTVLPSEDGMRKYLLSCFMFSAYPSIGSLGHMGMNLRVSHVIHHMLWCVQVVVLFSVRV